MTFDMTEVYTYKGQDVEFHYATTATYLEQAAFVDAATQSVIQSGNYIPLLKDIMFNLKLVQMFTDIDMRQFYVDDQFSLDAFEAFDNETGVSTMLKVALIDNEVMINLMQSIDDNIAYRTGIRRDEISTAIVELIRTLAQKIDSLGDGIETSAVNEFMKKFNESGFDGESLVDAYLNSEQYKKNVAEVVDAKNEKIRELQQQVNAETAKNVVADKKPAKKTTTKSATKSAAKATKTTTKSKTKADSESEIKVVKG